MAIEFTDLKQEMIDWEEEEKLMQYTINNTLPGFKELNQDQSITQKELDDLADETYEFKQNWITHPNESKYSYINMLQFDKMYDTFSQNELTWHVFKKLQDLEQYNYNITNLEDAFSSKKFIESLPEIKKHELTNHYIKHLKVGDTYDLHIALTMPTFINLILNQNQKEHFNTKMKHLTATTIVRWFDNIIRNYKL